MSAMTITSEARTSSARLFVSAFVISFGLVAAGCNEQPRSLDGEPTQADRERFSGRYKPPLPPLPPPLAPLASTGNPDHDFLRRMSDHQSGLMVVTHAAIESNRSPSLLRAIRKIEEDHDHELDAMLTLLRRIYKDEYVPVAPSTYTVMAGILRSGAGDSTSFFRSALQTEEKVLEMINAYLPKSSNAEVKRFAEELKRDEPREIAAIRRVLNQR